MILAIDQGTTGTTGTTCLVVDDDLLPLGRGHRDFEQRFPRPGWVGRNPAALAAGGTDNGAPGIRELYHPNYYGAYVLDPDGNNVEAVCHEGLTG